MKFERHIGIDYSGRSKSESRTPALQAFVSERENQPVQRLPQTLNGRRRNWSRSDLSAWLSNCLQDDVPTIVGIDHGFSFSEKYFLRYHLQSWDAFLEDFVEHWPTHRQGVTVEELRRGNVRSGDSKEFRLTELWSSSAKSVFQFDVQGSVAKSTHAGLPWIRELRRNNPRIHFWPFDGWEVPERKHVIAEVYPSLFSRRYSRLDGTDEERTSDEQDAYAVARWLSENDQNDFLRNYFRPELTHAEEQRSLIEGWILGIR